MKIEIIKRCRVDDKDCPPGTIVETDQNTAYDRIASGKAKAYVVPPKVVPVAPPFEPAPPAPPKVNGTKKKEEKIS